MKSELYLLVTSLLKSLTLSVLNLLVIPISKYLVISTTFSSYTIIKVLVILVITTVNINFMKIVSTPSPIKTLYTLSHLIPLNTAHYSTHTQFTEIPLYLTSTYSPHNTPFTLNTCCTS